MNQLTLTGAGVSNGDDASWTPALPTTNGGVLPHTWHNPAVANFQDSLLTTPSIADGDPTGGNTNQGTDAHNVIQATTAAKPTLKTGANGLNGHPVWWFDGGDWLRGAFAGGLLSQPTTIFAVAKLTVALDDMYHFLSDGDDVTNRNALFQYSASTPDVWAMQGVTQLIGINASDANWHLWTAVFNGASSQFWLDGISQKTGNAGAAGIDGLTLGATYGSIAIWTGDIAMYLLYPSNLSTADKNQVAQYLATYFGLSYAMIP
jgi:hypothetical protein